MSRQKQRRVLDSNPLILVATPGRLWDFIENENVPNKLNLLKYLVIDEADRMVELGHYKELDRIIDKIMLPHVITHDKQIIKDALRNKSDPIKLKVFYSIWHSLFPLRITRNCLTLNLTKWSKWIINSF